MADFNCPVCGNPMARRARKDGSGYFWSCTDYPDCKFIADDLMDEPFMHFCPECGQQLRARISKKNGKPYVACMNKSGHKSEDIIFFNEDGTPKGDDSNLPKAKGEFTCPECGHILKYFQFKNGQRAGQMGFGCFNSDEHKNSRPIFFDDNGGRPIM